MSFPLNLLNSVWGRNKWTGKTIDKYSLHSVAFDVIARMGCEVLLKPLRCFRRFVRGPKRVPDDGRVAWKAFALLESSTDSRSSQQDCHPDNHPHWNGNVPQKQTTNWLLSEQFRKLCQQIFTLSAINMLPMCFVCFHPRSTDQQDLSRKNKFNHMVHLYRQPGKASPAGDVRLWKLKFGCHVTTQ